MTELLKIENLRAGVEGKEILRGIDLSLAPGEVHVLLGPNGSGKSTLMNVLMGHPQYRVTEGSLDFAGESLLEKAPFERARAGLFLSFQSPEEIPGVTLENMLRTARQALTGEKVKLLPFRKALKSAMEELQMAPEYAQRYLNVGFSGGEKKRAEILQLLLLAPRLALLDETDSGLDVDAVQVVSAGVARFQRENPESAVLVITHNTRILEQLQVDKVHVLIEGKIAEEGGPELIGAINARGFAHLLEEEG